MNSARAFMFMSSIILHWRIAKWKVNTLENLTVNFWIQCNICNDMPFNRDKKIGQVTFQWSQFLLCDDVSQYFARLREQLLHSHFGCQYWCVREKIDLNPWESKNEQQFSRGFFRSLRLLKSDGMVTVIQFSYPSQIFGKSLLCWSGELIYLPKVTSICVAKTVIGHFNAHINDSKHR